MSFGIGSFGASRERNREVVVTSARPATGAQVAITARVSSRGDRATISIAAPEGAEPHVAEVNLLLVGAEIPTISLLSEPGLTRVTVPAEAQFAAVATLSEFVPLWEQRAAHPHKRRLGHLTASRS